MAIYVNPILLKVLERMAYERLLVVSGVSPRKRRLRLGEVLDAAELEPRLREILPILLLYRTRVLHRLTLDLKHYPQVARDLDHITHAHLDATFLGIPVADCLKTIETYRRIQAFQKQTQCARNLNIRLSEDDLRKLREICKKQGISNQSQLLRHWIEREYAGLR